MDDRQHASDVAYEAGRAEVCPQQTHITPKRDLFGVNGNVGLLFEYLAQCPQILFCTTSNDWIIAFCPFYEMIVRGQVINMKKIYKSCVNLVIWIIIISFIIVYIMEERKTIPQNLPVILSRIIKHI